jgi:UDP-N-acetyl-2-amino-2-deoxyglucuronate dehydrogenase
MADHDLGFALVGCGRISRRYIDLLTAGQVPGARLAALCDVRADRLAVAGAGHAIPAFLDMHEMMRASGAAIDVVCILTESGNHARHTVELAPYGKHIVVEKPMALDLDDADSMIQACDTAGIKLFVVKQNRFNRPVIAARHALDLGRFGKLVMGTVRVRWCRTQAYYDQDDWRGTWALDGGVFANQASHHIDLLEWMMGPVDSVFAKTRTALVDIEAEDTGVAVLRFRNGALGVVEATTATRPSDLEGSLSILGEGGSVEIGGFAVNCMKEWRFTATAPDDDSIRTGTHENPPNVYGFGHQAYLSHVVRSVRDGSPSLVDGLEGRKSLELISAIYESAESGREVEMRFRPRFSRLGSPGRPPS